MDFGLHPSPQDLEDAEPVYKMHGAQCALHPLPADAPTPLTAAARADILREWGRKRETHMHREPAWCMDQLVSGSGLYPPRHLANEWFTDEELQMITQLEKLLAVTGHGEVMARDMMALKIYDVDIRIIVDDSGSMTWSMFGYSERVGQGWDNRHISQVFGRRAFSPDSLAAFSNTDCMLRAGDARWKFAMNAVGYWEPVFNILGVRPTYYRLNQTATHKSAQSVFSFGPGGGTPMGATFCRVLADIDVDEGVAHRENRGPKTHLILALTDGEASDKNLFTRVLDSIQDGAYGDVQVCLMGLSLEPEDIRFFEDEECDDTRIRTIEAYEVEQQLILWRRVVDRRGDYNFAMHSVRALLTNIFPADYDYEAPMQTLRHRIYITLHALDRRMTGRRDNVYVDIDCTDCCAPLRLLFNPSAGRRSRQPADSAEAELMHVLCDPRFGSLIDRLRPPPKRLDQWGWGARQQRYPSDSTAQLYIQRAIGALQPSEFQNRDLQFANLSANAKSVRRAMHMLCLALGDPDLAKSSGLDR